MIEFKAECGHTIRANDDAAGDVVPCRYCGQEVRVPDSAGTSLDYLFSDVEQPEEEPKKRRGKKKKKRRGVGKADRVSGGVDVVAVILRMCYATFLLVVVIFVGDRYVMPHFREVDTAPVAKSESQQQTGKQTVTRRARRDQPRGELEGLTTRRTDVGLYVNCTPSSAKVYYLEESRAPNEGRIHNVKGCKESKSNGVWLGVADGSYVVELAIPWSDLSLSDSKLPYHREYIAFRRAIEYASSEKRAELAESYFVPDDADSVFVDESEDQLYVVRQYRGIRVRSGRSRGIRAIFLPRIAVEGSAGFSIQQLAEYYLPSEKVYRFNESHVRNELDYYEVPSVDRTAILESLFRIGVAPYMTRDGRTRLFSVGVTDGEFAARVTCDVSE